MSSTERCDLCPFNCDIPEGQVGKCRVRGNVNGQIQLLTYGKVTTAIAGPIEQKPLYHYHPGMKVLSIGSSGCNMFCGYCQNFEISQVGSEAEAKEVTPLDVVAMAKAQGAEAVCFTYSEPVVWFEYVSNVSRVAKKMGLKTILKTNGYCKPEKFKELLWFIDAVNIDVKGTKELYSKVVGIEVEDKPADWVILKNLRHAWRTCHTEVSTIAIPPYCDNVEKTRELFSAMLDCTSKMLPLHVLKFIPDFKLRNAPPPSDNQLFAMAELARTFFYNVYIDYAGLPTNTKCWKCLDAIIERNGIQLVKNHLGRRPVCNSCGALQYVEV